MPELQTMEQPKTAGFVNPNHNNRNRTRIEEEEKELEELQGKLQEGDIEKESTKEEQTDTEDEEKTLSREEKSFKKRYGDLRRHLSDKETEWKDKFESLEKRLDQENVVPPKSDEDIEQWSRKYPDVAGIVETIAAKKAQEMFSKAELLGVKQKTQFVKLTLTLINYVNQTPFMIGLTNNLSGYRMLCTRTPMMLTQ